MTNNLPSTETRAQPKSILVAVATRFQMEPEAFERTLRGTVFPANGTREQFAAFLVVADRYKLDPITKQIYAFPAKGGGIVPVVGIDGWIHLVNNHPQMNGMEFSFEHAEDGTLISCTCRIHRKDRQMPTVITEFLDECIRTTEPWKMKRRMLRHKALIQCARVAFGFSGIHDEDEARDIAENVNAPPPPPPPPPPPGAIAERDAGTVEDAVIVEPGQQASPSAQSGNVGEAQTAEEPAPFLYGEWLAYVGEQFATCMTEQDVDETHQGFADVVEEKLTRAQSAEYAELHEGALTRVTDAARKAEAPAEQQDDDEEAPADPKPPSAGKAIVADVLQEMRTGGGAPSLDDDDEDADPDPTPAELLHEKVDEYLARGDLTKELINDLVKNTNAERKAMKAAGHWTDEDKNRMSAAMDAAWKRLDEAELAAGPAGSSADARAAPEETELDRKVAAFTAEFMEKMDAQGSITELNAYFASTLPKRSEFGLDDNDPRKKAWKQKKIDRTAALNG